MQQRPWKRMDRRWDQAVRKRLARLRYMAVDTTALDRSLRARLALPELAAPQLSLKLRIGPA